MELKSVHWRFSANTISLFALNSQSDWLIFANLVIFRFFGSLTKLGNFWEIMLHKNDPEFLGSSDIFWLKKYFEFKKKSQIFKVQFLKPILKHVTSKFIVWKQQFCA